ncbi:MAG: hypothetical protein JSS09_06355, partial [Verrucomicrobia bacterium]|nr:hypothetical protein [Verrucomicrobiota bacterium]
IVFNPRIEGHYEGNYNIWRGFPVLAKRGDCSLFWKHVKDVICSGNLISYEYVRKWLANLIQKPWVVATSLILKGKQGTGKGTFVSAIGKLFGVYYAPLASLDQILGRFNAHLKNIILVFADEAIWGGNRKEVGILKALITESKLFIEAKGRDGYWINNCKHLIASSNEDWVVYLEPDDRRFFILDVSDSHKEDIPYFKAIDDQLENGGYEALMYDLLHEDLTGFDPRIMPENPAGFDMKMASTTSIDRFIYASLKLGSWDHENVVLLESLTMEKLYEYYKNWCEREKQEVKQSSLVGKRLHVIFEGLDITRTPRTENSARPPRYIFPPLLECRNSFEKFYKQTPVIWEWS